MGQYEREKKERRELTTSTSAGEESGKLECWLRFTAFAPVDIMRAQGENASPEPGVKSAK
jgi:hypothetical protein